MNADKYLESIGLENVIDEEFFNNDDKSWYKVHELMESYHHAKLKLLGIAGVSGRLSQQSEIVRQRLHYHFAKVGGGWNIEGMNAPFMKEFLNEVQKLVELSK